MSVIIRERDRDREYDDRSSTYRREGGAKGYTTVKRYRVPAREEEERDDRRTIVYSSDHGGERRSERDRTFAETRITRRERTPEPEPLPERLPERRDIRIERVEREREPEPPRRYAEYRFERDIDRLVPRREPYELERYSRSTEYFPRPDPPQPIIIRQEPQQIIIQEAPRAPIVVPAPQPPKEEADFQLIQRSEVVEDNRSIVSKRTDRTKRTENPKPEPREEDDYYYERRIREVKGGDRDDDFYEERLNRRHREVSPGESVSQVGRRRGRERDYSSDDSMVYVRRETRDAGYGSRSVSPEHRKHLAEGAIAGLGAAELLRHHRGKQGEETSSGGGRLARDIGAAGLGAVAAEGISRARSAHRDRSRRRRSYSRSRSRSDSRDTYRTSGRRRHRKKEKERSRSRSKSRVRQLAGLGLGAAAVAAAVGYANRKNKQNQQQDQRSRSRVRKGSVDPTEIPENDARNPQHRNKKIAQAGLAGAAVAGLVERARSKSRGAKGRERSKSRVRQGLPIAAAGLGTAAIAGLYERSQANKNEAEDQKLARAAHKERKAEKKKGRSRSRSVPYDGSREVGAAQIEYGDQPVYSAGGQDYYNRPQSQQGYYPPDAILPAAAAGAAYGAQREREMSRSRDRRRASSSSGSDSGRKRRHRRKKSESPSRSRNRDIAGAGAGAAALSAHDKKKQRRKEEKRERKRKYFRLLCASAG